MEKQGEANDHAIFFGKDDLGGMFHKEGVIQAELDVANMKPVPVSPKYYDQLSRML